MRKSSQRQEYVLKTQRHETIGMSIYSNNSWSKRLMVNGIITDLRTLFARQAGRVSNT